MTQTATVQKVFPGGMAEIAVPRKSACGHDCEECPGCGISGSAIVAVADNPIGAAPGNKVVVESSTKTVLGIIAMVYCIPIVLFLVGYFATESLFSSEGMRYASAVAGFLLGLLPAIIYDRRLRKKGSVSYTIVQNLSIS